MIIGLGKGFHVMFMLKVKRWKEVYNIKCKNHEHIKKNISRDSAHKNKLLIFEGKAQTFCFLFSRRFFEIMENYVNVFFKLHKYREL